MNKVEVLRRLNNINSEINDIYRREMLQEAGIIQGFKLFFTSGGSFFKNVGGVLKGVFGKKPQAIIDMTNQVNKTAEYLSYGPKLENAIRAKERMTLLTNRIYGWYSAMYSTRAVIGTGAITTATVGAGALINKLSGCPEDIPSTEEIQTIALTTSNINNGEISPEQERNLGALEKLWNSIQTQYKNFESHSESLLKNIGENVMAPASFIISGSILSLLLMFAGAVIYYINVGGKPGSSIQTAFSDAVVKIKNSDGAAQAILNICMAPANIILRFISQSPAGSIIFCLGICVFMFNAIIAFTGRNALFEKRIE